MEMNINWEELWKENKEEYQKLYKEFVYNKSNICNCDNCPRNENQQGKYPCGQQNCWVLIHCNPN